MEVLNKEKLRKLGIIDENEDHVMDEGGTEVSGETDEIIIEGDAMRKCRLEAEERERAE
jgi:hypothetical protein